MKQAPSMLALLHDRLQRRKDAMTKNAPNRGQEPPGLLACLLGLLIERANARISHHARLPYGKQDG